jgi:hypothetical protein
MVESLLSILGMQPCEGTEAVPPNARSHTLLLAGVLPGALQALVRLSLGIDAAGQVGGPSWLAACPAATMAVCAGSSVCVSTCSRCAGVPSWARA